MHIGSKGHPSKGTIGFYSEQGNLLRCQGMSVANFLERNELKSKFERERHQ